MKIQMTAEDMSKGMPFKPGWHKASITECVATPHTSKKGNDVIKMLVTFNIEGLEEARTFDTYFYSNGLGFMKPLLAAVAGKPLSKFIEENKAGIEFDLDALKGKKCQVKIGESKPTPEYPKSRSEVQDYAPYDTIVPF